MQAVILAGGKGTRLGEIARDIPKPMVPVAGKPILEHQVELLSRHGIDDIIMITGHMSDVIERHFGDGARFGVRVRYYVEEMPLGTTGGIKMVEELLSDEFLVLYGDVMMDVDFGRMLAFHREKASRCTLALHPNDHPHDSDLVEIDAEGRVVAFHAKPHPAGFEYHNLVNAALYVLTKDVVARLERGVKADFGKDVFPRIAGELAMFGYVTPEYMKDVGTPERIAETERDLASGKFARRSLSNRRPAVFLDRDGVLNREVNLLSRVDQLELLPRVTEAVGMLNRSDFLAVVVTNQPVIARGLCSLADLDAIHKRLETRLGAGRAWLDAIEFCPHHPDAGFPGERPEFKIDCVCRKPKTGMIGRAAARFNIDLSASWIVGDSGRDIECGRSAGLMTAGVRTGYGCRDAPVRPDYMFDDLYEAVGFIVGDPFAAAVSQVLDRIGDTRSGPALVLVGGLSRSGKSTFARRLAAAARARDIASLTVSLDQWLVPAAERSAGMDVHDRFRSGRAARDIAGLLAGDAIEVPGYDELTRECRSPLGLALAGERLVVVEGVTALHEESLCRRAAVRVTVRVPEEKRRARFDAFYRWKGLDEGEIGRLWRERIADETEPVAQDLARADIEIDG